MLAPLVTLLALAAAPPPVTCDEVSRVHALAVSQGLDDRSLRTLENRVCGGGGDVEPPASPKAGSRECINLRIMSSLAHTDASGLATGDLQDIDSMRNVACSVGLSPQTWTWSNGSTFRQPNGVWYWPNRHIAFDADASIHWPSGHYARFQNGSWAWPDGRTAKDVNGAWTLPDGRSATRDALLVRACGQKPRMCQQLRRADQSDPNLATALTIAAVWSTR